MVYPKAGWSFPLAIHQLTKHTNGIQRLSTSVIVRCDVGNDAFAEAQLKVLFELIHLNVPFDKMVLWCAMYPSVCQKTTVYLHNEVRPVTDQVFPTFEDLPESQLVGRAGTLKWSFSKWFYHNLGYSHMRRWTIPWLRSPARLSKQRLMIIIPPASIIITHW